MGFDPTITQKVRTALREAGRDDLVDEQIVDAIRSLETTLLKENAELRKMVHAIDHKYANRVTDTGLQRALDGFKGKEAIDWLKWGKRTAVGALVGLLLKFAWRGLTH